MKDKKIFQRRKTIISFLISFLILFFLIGQVDIGETFALIKNVDVSLYFLAFLTMYLSLVFRILRWKKLLQNIGVHGKIKKLTEIYLSSSFLNFISPAKIGDFYRGYLVKKNMGTSISKVIGTIFMDRSIDAVSAVFLVTVSTILIFKGQIPKNILLSIGIGAALVALLIAIFIIMKFIENNFIGFLPERIRGTYMRFWVGTRHSITHDSIPFFFFISVLIWAFEGIRYFLVLKSLSLEISIGVIFFIALASAFLSGIPLTPAGLGTVEAASVGLWIFFGIDKETAMAIVLLDRIISYWSIMVVGGLFYFPSLKT